MVMPHTPNSGTGKSLSGLANLAKNAEEKKLTPGSFRARNGEILKFRSSDASQLDIPEDLKEPGWSYQWQAHTVYGAPSQDLAQMYANGWRFVTNDSRVGEFFVLPGETGDCIIRGGLVLMERPDELTEMYREETNAKTRLQYASLMDKSSDLAVPEGFESPGKRVSRERTLAEASAARALFEATAGSDGIPDED
jgi:hypothetical protein